ncbi:MAG: hypothetical protein Q9192_002617 [Flavoplaca navasiana]
MEFKSSTPENLPVYYVGQHESKRQLPISPHTVSRAFDCNLSQYDMVTTPITTPMFHSRVLSLLSNHFLEHKDGYLEDATPTVTSLAATDTAITPGDTIQKLVGTASPWVDLSSPDPIVYNISCQVLQLEISYAAFCGLGNLVLQGPKLQYGGSHGEGVVQYAYAVQELLALNNYTQILIHLPMMYHPDQDGDDVEGSLSTCTRQEYVEEGGRSKHDLLGTWDAWHIIRTLCKYNSRLFVALSIPRHLPATHAQTRWHSEPLRLLSLAAQTFVPNPDGSPALSKYHQSLIHRYMRLRTPPWILLCDVGPIPGLLNLEAEVPKPWKPNGIGPAEASKNPEKFPEILRGVAQNEQHNSESPTTEENLMPPHVKYIRKLQKDSPPQSTLEYFGAGYFQDYLQGPLQPLSDNLESVTYEVFEKDPVKYDLYESAIYRALTDWISAGKTTSGPARTIVVAVVGAGRGPLVTRALRASETAGVKIELWAVEKNPNAFVLLQHHNEHSWSNQVHLVQSDMRSWEGPMSTQTAQQQQQPQYRSNHPHIQSHRQLQKPQPQQPHKIDILISELLGSFADNELSPECLDPLITNLLNPTHGISIPSSYTSHLTPIAAPKLHADIASRTPSDPKAPNTPYVVMLHAIDYLSTTPPENPSAVATAKPIVKEAWKFSHGVRANTSASPLSGSNERHEKNGGSNTHPADKSKIAINHDNNKHNTRSARLTFPTPHRGCMHGLAGYFEAVLYGDIELSTHPLRADAKSKDMTSWFPIYFPLQTPLYTPDNSSLTVTMRRCTDARKVWYEWMVESFMEVPGSPPSELSVKLQGDRDSVLGGDTVSKGYSAQKGERDSAASALRGRPSEEEKKKKKRVRLGVSEVGSSKESGCVM